MATHSVSPWNQKNERHELVGTSVVIIDPGVGSGVEPSDSEPTHLALVPQQMRSAGHDEGL